MTDETVEFDLGRRASLAIEGSIGGKEGLRCIFDYVHAVLKARGDEMHASGLSGAALAFFLAYIRQAADPEGDSLFRIRIERRNPNSKKTPAEVRSWEHKHVILALIVESLVEDEGWKKESAIAHVCNSQSVRRQALFEAEKKPLFERLVLRQRRRRSPST